MARRLSWTHLLAAQLLLGFHHPALAGHGAANVQVYNAIGVQSAGGALSVSGGLGATYYADAGLENGTYLTVTLPQGFTFGSIPALKAIVTGVLEVGKGGMVVSGGTGSGFVTYRLIGSIPAGAPLVLTGGSTGTVFTVENAFALTQQSSEPLAIAFQASGNAMPARNDPVPVTVPAFRSSLGVELTLQTQNNSIDVTWPSLGAKFTASGGTIPAAAYLGSVSFHVAGNVLNADASAFTVGPDDASTLTVRGAFRHLSGAYLDPGNSACSTVPPAGAIIGAVSATSLIFAGVLPQRVYGVCLIADGVRLLDENPAGSIRFSLPKTLRFGPAYAADPSDIRYDGGVVTPRLTFITGSDAGYSSLVSITNQSATTATLYAVAEPFTGGPPLPGLLGTLAAGAGMVFTEAQIGTATGLSLANSGQRAVVRIIGVGADDVTASSLLVNPGGVVDNVR
ncbi:hypothetical protein [Methylocystis heyeri]|uniref:hypothetical protein n=1 Tax=Methylocystis heyeri TaxID=391905 RepID=UPI001389EADB|nr:hypothetical protein [Methylocystis heyeri]